MPKVVRLFNEQERNQQGLVAHIEGLLEMAKRGEIKKVMIAAESSDSTILTGYYNLDVQEKQYMIGHFQADVTMAIVEANVDRLIEYIE
ncbi:hypothetical protein KZX50_00545 [Bacillus infantis]|uniref:hypothetical protein n=1 Tax=Bacillus infantis TaxID=324767 RepID=UPI002005AACC|nr:hypothetical protein [Bacillus infantis]MCK6203936.1 hypothetical protein [Bacillus infantis]